MSFRPLIEAMEGRVLFSGGAVANVNPATQDPFGNTPKAAVTFDSSGDLYGTTFAGGTSRDGILFEIPKGRKSAITIASFDGTNGEEPVAAVTFDSSGDLYGTTLAGGISGEGTVFEIAKGSTSLTTIASFDGTNGEEPAAAVTFDSSGNMYGTTEDGGADGDGTVFEIPKGSTSLTTLASFNGTNGANPTASLTIDSNGNLYGTTEAGGAGEVGTVFEIPKSNTSLTTLASFDITEGGGPSSAVTLDSNGDLFGTTSTTDGGSGKDYGRIFEIPKGSTSINTIALFDGTNGSAPTGALTLAPNGNLYGTTELGGIGFEAGSDDFGRGTVFQISPRKATIAGNVPINTVARFRGPNGANPIAAVTFDAKGNLFGTTEYGGIGYEPLEYPGGVPVESSDTGLGTVFRISKGTRFLTPVVRFNSEPVFVLSVTLQVPADFVYSSGKTVAIKLTDTGNAGGSGPFSVSLALSASENGSDAFAAGPTTALSGRLLPGKSRIAHVRLGPATGASPTGSYYLVAQVTPEGQNLAVSMAPVLAPRSIGASETKVPRVKPGATVKLTIKLTNTGAEVAAGTISDPELFLPTLPEPIAVPGTATFSISSGAAYYDVHATAYLSFQAPTPPGTYQIYAAITGAVVNPMLIGSLTVLP
jgi:uncharacterized repeat protein (TIGR03803 family)